MATVSFATSPAPSFDLEALRLNYSGVSSGTSTYWSWVTSAATPVSVKLTGTGFQYGLNPVGGTVTGFEVDVGNDGVVDIRVSGLSFNLLNVSNPLTGDALDDAAETDLLWWFALNGADTINLPSTPSPVSIFAGDGRHMAGSAVTGQADTFTGSTSTYAVGDFLLTGGTVTGGNDTMTATGGDLVGDVVFAGRSGHITGGNDVLTAASGTSVYGDVIAVDEGSVTGGHDSIVGSGGAETLYGDAASVLDGSLYGGNDTIRGGGGADTIFGDVDVTALASVVGGNDQLFGDAGDDKLYGNGGNDTLDGGSGNDTLDGSDGTDTAAYSGRWVDYDIVAQSGGQYSIIDRVAGRDGTDTITGIEQLSFVGGGGIAGLSIALNHAPLAKNDTNTADPVVEDNDLFAAGNVLANDSDANSILGDVKTVNGVRTGTEAAGGSFAAAGGAGIKGTFGTLLIAANGAYTYTLDNADPDTQAIRPGQTASDVFTYRLTDTKGLTTTALVTIAIGGDTAPPTITSNGAGASAAVAIVENTTFVTTLAAFDPDSAPVTFQLAGADAGRFVLVGNQLHFASPADFDTRTDANLDGVYDVSVLATVGTALDAQTLSISLANIAGNTIRGNSKANKIDTIKTIKGLGATEEEDRIDGRQGNDTIKGAGGNDTLIGGDGKDQLYGGTGSDAFMFNTRLVAANVDTVRDFTHDVDLLMLDDKYFKKIGAVLDVGEVYAKAGATKAHDRDDRIIYNTKTGKLYFDQDGSKGGHDAIHFATLSTKPLLDAGDFLIV